MCALLWQLLDCKWMLLWENKVCVLSVLTNHSAAVPDTRAQSLNPKNAHHWGWNVSFLYSQNNSSEAEGLETIMSLFKRWNIYNQQMNNIFLETFETFRVNLEWSQGLSLDSVTRCWFIVCSFSPVPMLQGELQHYQQTVLSGPWSFVFTQLETRVFSQEWGPVRQTITQRGKVEEQKILHLL